MKIFTSAQIHELDRYTIEHEPIKSVDLMERAAKAITRAVAEEWTTHTPVVVFAGPGNNGGDALAVARLLTNEGYKVNPLAELKCSYNDIQKVAHVVDFQ